MLKINNFKEKNKMVKQYAKKGGIPGLNQIWQPVGEKLQLFMVHLFKIKNVRPYVPVEFEIVPVAPGLTLGYVFNGYFGPASTLEYHEFIVAPALVKANGHKGFYITHMYVDNEKSLIGGRRMGLPKEMIKVKWNGFNKDRVQIIKDGNPLITISYKKHAGFLKLTGSANVLSKINNQIFFCKNRLNARWSLCTAKYEFETGTLLSHDLRQMGISKPLISFAGENMVGEMGANQQFI